MKRVSLIAMAVLAHLTPLSASAEAYGSGWYRELQVTVGQEDNVARSYQDDDVFDDLITTASFGLGYSRKLGRGLQYVAGGYLSHTEHDEFDALSHTAISLNGSLIWQPGTGFDSPWYRISGEVTRLSYPDSEAREGYLATAGVSINRRFGMRAVGRAGYRYLDFIFDKDDAASNRDAAFDVARHEVGIGLDYLVAGDTWLVLDYAFQHGGFTASSSISPGEIDYEAETEDPAFEACSIIRCVPFYAYRDITDVHTAEIALVFPLLGFDVDLSARYIDARTDGGIDYNDWIAQAGIVWTF